MRHVLALVLLLLAGEASSHDWYDSDCCSGRDCAPVAYEDVEQLSDGGWRYVPLNVKFTRGQVRPSKDNHFHVCVGESQDLDGTVHRYPRCIYVVQSF